MKERRRWDSHSFSVGAIVGTMATVAITGVIGVFVLAYQGKPIPDLLAGMIGGALTGLPSLLAQTGRAASEKPTDVNVVNKPSEPVPTTDAPAESEV